VKLTFSELYMKRYIKDWHNVGHDMLTSVLL